MTIKLGVIMDPISQIHVEKDSTFAMLLAAQQRNWQIYYFEPQDISLKEDVVFGDAKQLQVFDDSNHWFKLTNAPTLPLNQLDIILMRQDPPVTMDYIYITQLLDLVKETLIVNSPQSLRDFNEKLFIHYFPQCCAPTLVTCNKALLQEFHQQQGSLICKPLNGMGGERVFLLKEDDRNANVVFETLTHHGKALMVAQRYIPEISAGDKRVLFIDGEPLPFALARIPAQGEVRGNLAVGGKGVGMLLSDRDRWICEQVGPVLRKNNILFAGIDIIGDYLTEINITSPTCIRQLEKIYQVDIAGQLLDCLEKKIGSI